MKTNLLPGLRTQATQLAVPSELIMFLIAQIGPRWSRAYPNALCGRPRADVIDLLFATLLYLREQTTFARAAAAAGLGESTLHDHFHAMVDMIAEVGVCQADGTLLTEEGLARWCEEMKAAGELALIDGVATRCPRPGNSWLGQKIMYDSKRHCHAVNTQTLTTQCGDLLAVHGGWPGSVTEAEQLRHSHFIDAVTASGVGVVTDAGYRSARGDLGVRCRAGNHKTPQPGDAEITRVRAENERPHHLLKAWRIMDRTRIRGVLKLHRIATAVAVLVGLKTYGHRRADWA